MDQTARKALALLRKVKSVAFATVNNGGPDVLSNETPIRERFAFGGETVNPPGYRITEKCVACGDCLDACPLGVITAGDVYRIDGSRCLECGRCAEVCPEDAIKAALGL